MIEYGSRCIAFDLHIPSVMNTNAIVDFCYRRAVGKMPRAVVGICVIAPKLGILKAVPIDLNIVALRSRYHGQSSGGLLDERRVQDHYVLPLDIEAVAAARDLHTVDHQAVHARGPIVRLELAAARAGAAHGEDTAGVAGDVEAGVFSGRHK